jgi:hypothetical protein
MIALGLAGTEAAQDFDFSLKMLGELLKFDS